MTLKKWQIWIDTGGTFTDCIALDPYNHLHQLKVLSNSTLRGRIKDIQENLIFIEEDWPVSKNLFDDYHFRTLDGSFKSVIRKFDPGERTLHVEEHINSNLVGLDFEITANEEVPVLATRVLTETPLDQMIPEIDLKLGSTKGTNALLERKTSRTGLIITKGFRDLLKIGTQQRPDLFSLQIEKILPYYHDVFEVQERMNPDGTVELELSFDDIPKILHWIKDNNIESVAIAFLFSYRNPLHEKRLKHFLESEGIRYISLSNDLFNAIKILPRAETAVVNAALSPVIESYLEGITSKIKKESTFRVMTSAGGLSNLEHFRPKDSLLSGPAGGLVGSSLTAVRSGFNRIITFDMGGTSTDVSRYDHEFEYTYETNVGGATILSPAMHIETIAAGGGSICSFDGSKFNVGPESAGSTPGPACYGANGPFTITDVNLLLGKINPNDFGIPVHLNESKKVLTHIQENILKEHGSKYSELEILKGFEQIANEKMAEAIKKISVSKGFSPSDHSLVAFGGAGGLHACQIADILNIDTVIIPDKAGLLSAFGIGNAFTERFLTRQILKKFNDLLIQEIEEEYQSLQDKIYLELYEEGYAKSEIHIRQKYVYVRFAGQDTALELTWDNGIDLERRFKESYQKRYGHWISQREIEIESIKCIGSNKKEEVSISQPKPNKTKIKTKKFLTTSSGVQVGTFNRNELNPGNVIDGPAIIGSKTHTTFLPENWTLFYDEHQNEIISREQESKESQKSLDIANIELYINRFTGIAEEMGAMLQKASFSVNIKERLDFSCAILDKNGYLVVNAPHIPVHLGSLGICVREVKKHIEFREGDIVITNHPKFGGSHLPDITLISAIFFQNEIIGYVANRAHHAEIGGKTPGSMPVDATRLEEEGVIIDPEFIIHQGQSKFESIKEILTAAKYPTRSIEENLADLQGGVASIQAGIQGMQELCKQYSKESVIEYLEKIQAYSSSLLSTHLEKNLISNCDAIEFLDDKSPITVEVQSSGKKIKVDFTGSSDVHPGNMNATPAITTSAVLYVLRLILDRPVPLNEGLLRNLTLVLPEKSILNPDFNIPNELCPAVVGGNTETSQRIVDTLLKALGAAACSQGTMNNVVFGNDEFGYYETICGGTGAGKEFDGADAVHQHMTNTRITDPEVIEHRYPVKIKRFEIRKDSGGKGVHKGGNGSVREYEFTEESKLTVLAEHRSEQPYGLNNGNNALPGIQYVITAEGKRISLRGKDHYDMKIGDRFVIETPGGGGYGQN